MACLQTVISAIKALSIIQPSRLPLREGLLGPYNFCNHGMADRLGIGPKNQNHQIDRHLTQILFSEDRGMLLLGDSFPEGVVNASHHLRASSQTAQKQPPEKRRRSKVKLPQNEGLEQFLNAFYILYCEFCQHNLSLSK